MKDEFKHDAASPQGQAERGIRKEREQGFDAARKHLVAAAEGYLKIGKVGDAYRIINSYDKKPAEWGVYKNNVAEINSTIEEERRGKDSGLKEMSAAASLLFLVGSMFFLSFNLTGAVIGNLAGNDFQVIGVALFTLGLVATMAFFRLRR